MNPRIRAGLVVLVLWLAAITGCSASGSSRIQDKPAESFATLADLQRAAQLQVVATVTNSTRVEQVGAGDPVDFTVTSVVIARSSNKTLAALGQTLQIRQTGTVARPLEEDPILPAGKKVMLFLERFHITAADQTNQWVIKGLWLGQFLESASGEYEQAAPPSGERTATFHNTLPVSALAVLE